MSKHVLVKPRTCSVGSGNGRTSRSAALAADLILRHTAATEMLRHDVPLEKIGLVLRHRGIDTTAHYAKADVTLLKQIAQPWPEAL